MAFFGLYPNTVTYLREYMESIISPLVVQERLLKRILDDNKDTIYGQTHNFSSIKTIEDFQKQVPVVQYLDIKNYIDKTAKEGRQNVLTKEEIIFFATSSGTTSEPKYIPITKERLKILKKEVLLWSKQILKKEYRDMAKGKTLYFAAAGHLGYTKSGIPHGNITGFHVKHLPKYLKRKMVIPAEMYNINDVEKRSKAIAEKALLERNITQLAFAAPIEIMLFFDYIKQHKKNLLKTVEKKNPKRAKELRSLEDFIPKDIWPNIKLISCIKADINNLYIEELYNKIGKKIPTRDPGIYASEGRINLGITDYDNAGVLVANTNFFEFREQLSNGNFDQPVTIDKLEKNKKYNVLLTTIEGLYRYDVGDIVEVVDFRRKLPIVKYADRNNYINIVGENMSEIELIKAIEQSIQKTKIELRSYTAAPHIPSGKEKPRYEILIEPKNGLTKEKAIEFLKMVENTLQKNVLTYKKARNEFGRIDYPSVCIMAKGTYDKLDKERISKRGQAKPLIVSKDPHFRERFKFKEVYFYKN